MKLTLIAALEALEEKQLFVDDAMNEAEEAEQEVARAIRRARQERKISLRSFAAKLGLSAAYISDIELGRRYPSYETLEKIKKELLPTKSNGGIRPKHHKPPTK